ncbi:hypothetical protein HNQ71_002143 [Mesorhizobium sangaii]|uniref:Uncharacterized protein n=1 Tax=Mesorhizobium sangaii TaxID=505389 RepID=A0A841P9J4_9HYPH|nr:hypothetical protein [Mesorhizobium sangaii]
MAKASAEVAVSAFNQPANIVIACEFWRLRRADSQYRPTSTVQSKGCTNWAEQSSRLNIEIGSSATPAPWTAAFAMVTDESKTMPLIGGQWHPAVSNQRSHSSSL